jgi:hypothetical protein
MSKNMVYPFTYYNGEHGSRFRCNGMITKEKFNELREKNNDKDYQLIESEGEEIDDSLLNESGRYHPSTDDKNI